MNYRRGKNPVSFGLISSKWPTGSYFELLLEWRPHLANSKSYLIVGLRRGTFFTEGFVVVRWVSELADCLSKTSWMVEYFDFDENISL